MSDDEIIAINRDTFFTTDDTAAHWLAFGRAIERRTLERAAKVCEEMAKQFDNGAGYSAQRCAYALNALVAK